MLLHPHLPNLLCCDKHQHPRLHQHQYQTPSLLPPLHQSWTRLLRSHPHPHPPHLILSEQVLTSPPHPHPLLMHLPAGHSHLHPLPHPPRSIHSVRVRVSEQQYLVHLRLLVVVVKASISSPLPVPLPLR